MANVIERVDVKIDDAGTIHFDDRPVSWEDADKLYGKRLDRRFNYAIIDGEICSLAKWTSSCSGCSEGLDERGHGCEECGYHGVVRRAAWVPHHLTDLSS